MAEHDVLGRDVHAWADSELDAPAAVAVKALWSWCGLDGGESPNHLWTFDVTGGTDGFSVSAVVKDANVYVAPPAYVDVPATPAELARQADGTEAAVDSEVAGETAADTAADEDEPVAEVIAEEAATEPAPDAEPEVAPESPAEPEAPADPDAPPAS